MTRHPYPGARRNSTPSRSHDAWQAKGWLERSARCQPGAISAKFEGFDCLPARLAPSGIRQCGDARHLHRPAAHSWIAGDRVVAYFPSPFGWSELAVPTAVEEFWLRLESPPQTSVRPEDAVQKLLHFAVARDRISSPTQSARQEGPKFRYNLTHLRDARPEGMWHHHLRPPESSEHVFLLKAA
jgi:hypothetical protein